MIKKLLLVSRPISWINTAYPFAAAYLVLGGPLTPFFIITTLFFLIPYNFVLYGINDVYDYESDLKNPRKGGIEGAKESKALHVLILASSTLLALPFIIYIYLNGTVWSSVVFSLVMFMVVAYSIKGLRFKEIPLLDSVTSSLHFVGPALFALSLFDDPSGAWPYMLAFFFWGIASHAYGAVQDIIPDREGNLHSIATVFGAKRTMRLAFAMYALSVALLVFTGWPGVAVAAAGTLYILNCLPYVHISDEQSGLSNHGWRRFIWLNMITGAVVTVSLLLAVS